MADVAVVNASPPILLARCRQLELLRLAAPTVLVPEPVRQEVSAHADDRATADLWSLAWLQVVPAVAIPDVIRVWDLGAGETSVLALAQERSGAEAVLDDLAGRRCAATLQVPVRGTLGLALLAKQRGVVPAARPIVEDLRHAWMYLSEHVLRRALALVGV